MRPQLRFMLPAASAVLTIVLVLVLVLGGSHHGYPSHPAGQNGGFDGAAFPGGVSAQDFTLTDQHGHKVSLRAHRGQVVALVFLPPLFGVPSACRMCVLVAQQVRGALDELGSSPGVSAIFVSSETSAPRARVGRFLRETSLTGRVEYLTGRLAQLRPLWHTYGVPPPSTSTAAREAAITVLLIDRGGMERVGFGLEQLTPESLAHDIRRLQTG